MLIKLSIVSASHVVKYKSRITFCEDKSSISVYISKLNLDDGTLCLHRSILEVLVSTGSFNDGTLLDQGSLEIITFEELKKSLPGGKNKFQVFNICFFMLCVGSFRSI